MSHAIRRFRPDDRDKVIAFAASLPEHDLLFLSRDVREPRVVAAWLDAIEAGLIDSLIAEDGGEIVATAALVHDPLGWSAHVGEVRLLVAPGRRGSGLGSDLLQGIFMIAQRTRARQADRADDGRPDRVDRAVRRRGVSRRSDAQGSGARDGRAEPRPRRS